MADDLKTKVREWAILSRLFLLVTQILLNAVIPDHDADAFFTPIDEDLNFLDWISSFLFGGLSHWDGQHFVHIAKFGYTYENNLAFFPLYPLLIKILANTIGIPLQSFISYHNVIVLCGICVNFFCFVLSAEILYELSRTVLRDEKLAYRAALLYCINPASIFFSAVYTESVFALCSFSGMLFYQKNCNYLSALCFAFGGATRSNGIINCGFPIYYEANKLISDLQFQMSKNSPKTTFGVIFLFLTSSVIKIMRTLSCICIITAPLLAHQIYAYVLYCEKRHIDATPAVKELAVQKGLLMPSSDWTPSWCENSVPTSYNVVQEKYWDVGFLKYYQWKQIPNFLFVVPITLIILRGAISYCFSNPKTCKQLGLGIRNDKDFNNIGINSPLIFIYLVHCTFLLMFDILFINVQVVTRMLCSSSPVVFWLAASITALDTKQVQTNSLTPDEVCKKVETSFNMSRWGDNIILDQMQNWQHGTRASSLLFVYFLSYFIFGVALFVNIFPFT